MISEINIKSFDELTEIQRLCLADFSYSRIDTYKTCPAKYFYSYIQKEPRSFNEAATLGNVVHSVLEECIDNTRKLDLYDLHKEYKKQKASYDPDNLIADSLLIVGSEILDEFYDTHIDYEFNIFEKEMGFNFIIGNYSINGFIDRIDFFDDETINIIDYKTRKMGSSPERYCKKLTAWHLCSCGFSYISR